MRLITGGLLVPVEAPVTFSPLPTAMPFFQALGLGVVIVVLQVLTPVIFTEIESTAVAFLVGARTSAEIATDLAASVGHAEVSPSASRPLSLPRAAQVRPME